MITHPNPFLLLGADVLRGGRKTTATNHQGPWNFRALIADTVEEDAVDAYLEFERNGQRVQVPLPHAPAGEAEGKEMVAYHAAGRQCLRRNVW